MKFFLRIQHSLLQALAVRGGGRVAKTAYMEQNILTYGVMARIYGRHMADLHEHQLYKA